MKKGTQTRYALQGSRISSFGTDVVALAPGDMTARLRDYMATQRVVVTSKGYVA